MRAGTRRLSAGDGWRGKRVCRSTRPPTAQDGLPAMQDGALLIHDLAAGGGAGLLASYRGCFEGEAVTAVRWWSPQGDEQRPMLTAASAGSLYVVDPRCPDPVHRICLEVDGDGDELNAIDTGRKARLGQGFLGTEKDPNRRPPPRPQGMLAVASDSGRVHVLEPAAVASGRRVQAPTGGLRPSREPLQGAHSNIVSCLAFRSSKPSELLTGGLDCRLVRWEVASGRAHSSWSTSERPTPPGESDATTTGRLPVTPPLVQCMAEPEIETEVRCFLGGQWIRRTRLSCVPVVRRTPPGHR